MMTLPPLKRVRVIFKMQYSSKEVRQLCRENKFKIQHTAGLCPGYVQTNLIVLNKTEALDFLIFCQRNPKSCPVVV